MESLPVFSVAVWTICFNICSDSLESLAKERRDIFVSLRVVIYMYDGILSNKEEKIINPMKAYESRCENLSN